jgi:uncharacterized protein (TIGR03067 family)
MSTLMVMLAAVAADVPKGGLLGELEDDLSCLQGAWVLQADTYDGTKVPKAFLIEDVFLFNGNKLSLIPKAGGRATDEWTLALNTTRKPKEIDFRKENDLVRTVYRMEGGTLCICVGNRELKTRPKDFSARQGSGERAMVFKRVGK